jgi:hypothetical protein
VCVKNCVLVRELRRAAGPVAGAARAASPTARWPQISQQQSAAPREVFAPPAARRVADAHLRAGGRAPRAAAQVQVIELVHRFG